MNRQQLQLAIHDTNSSLEFLHSRYQAARDDMYKYSDDIEETESYLELLQEQFDALGDEP